MIRSTNGIIWTVRVAFLIVFVLVDNSHDDIVHARLLGKMSVWLSVVVDGAC